MLISPADRGNLQNKERLLWILLTTYFPTHEGKARKTESFQWHPTQIKIIYSLWLKP